MASARPPLWNVPYQQNQYFTGREETLRQLHRALREANAVGLTQPQGVSGLGGIGKTQTVVEFAYRYGMEYEAVFWVRADSLTTLNSSFQELARLLLLPERQEQDQRIVIEAVLRWLRQHSRWLLIFDNMDDLALAEPFLPKAGQGHLIFTTRARAFGNLAQRLEILQMEPEIGALLLLRRASIIPLQALLSRATREERDLACDISRVLDGLPLALDQAGAYIKETPSTLADYFRLYQQRRADLLKMRGTDSQDYPASVATTWSLSFEKVTQANPAATDLLTLCAFLAPDAIPETIFTAGAPYLGDLLAPVAANQHQFNLACGVALRYSLIARESTTETLTMHRLVQTILYENTPVKNQRGWRLMPASFSQRQFVATQRDWKQRAVLATQAASPNSQHIEQWSACDVWVPHVLVCADWIEQEQFYKSQSAEMLIRAGVYLDARGRYAEAKLVYRNALAISEQLFGANHPYTAQYLVSLGGLYYHLGKYSAAEPLLKRALAIFEQTLGANRSRAEIDLANPSAFYKSQEELEKSQGELEQTNPLQKRTLVINKQLLGTLANNLGALYEAQGKYEEAQTMYQRAQTIHKQPLGAQAIHEQQLGLIQPNEAQNFLNQAILLIRQGEYVKAEQLLKRALAIQKRQLGTEHPDTTESLNSLGLVYKFQKKYEEAELLFQQALEIRERMLGAKHPNTATCLDNLANLYYTQGKYQEVESLAKRALAIWEHHSHPNVLHSLTNLGCLYHAQEKYEEAESFLQRALVLGEQRQGKMHPNTAAALSNLALLYRDQQKYKEAEPLLKRALAIRKQHLGATHPDTVDSRTNLEALSHKIKQGEKRQQADETVASLNAQAKQAESQGKYAEAEGLYRCALEQQEQQLGINHLNTAFTYHKLGELYDAQGRYQEAARLYKCALEIRVQLLGTMHLDTVQSLDNLGELYKKLGKYKDAEPFLKRAQAIRKCL
jgi:tetratricopeptide (TPR) repeat protein